ncbi:MAG TPA: redoxin domain-containing protein [Cryomorphaceae bacterium]|nr:redoxin domain-containing protein [Cryomorphaceae bacterium]
MTRATFILILLISVSCAERAPIGEKFATVDRSEIQLDSALSKKAGIALLFLSPECPLCQNYSVTIDRIQDSFKNENIAFYGVVSGEYYSESDIKGFLIRYKLDLPILLDPKFKLAGYYEATTTPEVVLIGEDGEELYQGAIDNWAISLGQKRLTITEHYLEDALSAHLQGKEINPKKTKAVGCFIE